MNGSEKSEMDLFTEAVQLPVEQRSAFLMTACGGDAELRANVEALLEAHQESGGFLEQAPEELKAQAGVPGEKPGEWIGRYKLLEQIGEGGCGVVFMAEQEEPVRRKVALKIVKPGMDTKTVIARFEAKRQALALMDHPNIAGLDEVRRVIRDEEPIRPSTRLSTMIAADLTSLSKHRQAEPPRLIREVRGDLDWIVMKALEKDRTRRYQTVIGLAHDLQRYFAGEVISARPPSAAYKFQKMFLRNKLLFSGIGIIFLLLMAGLAITVRLLAREKQARQWSEINRLEALARMSSEVGKVSEAERMYRQSMAVRRAAGLPTTEQLDRLEALILNTDKFDEADALIKEVLPSTTVGVSDYVDLFILRADLLARQGRWKEAAADAAQVVEYCPENHESYHMLAPLLVASGDLKGYQQLCRRIVARFGDTSNLSVADRMAKDCLVLPSAGVDLEPVAAMAEFAVTKGAEASTAPFYQCCKALAEYRQGHFEGALEWAERAAKNPFPYSQAEACAVLAMSQYQLKQVANARAALVKGDMVVAEHLPKLGIQRLGLDWRDWIIVHALLDEAHGLIEGTTSTNMKWR